VIVPSASTAADVERLLPKAHGKVIVIPEAADDFLQGEAGTPAERRARWISPPGLRWISQPYLLCIGNTRWHKDLPTLLRAFGELAAERPDVLLILVGPEPSGYLDQQLREAPPELRSRVAFTGHVDDSELRALYSGAVAFVFPSLREGFGLPVLEALAFGTPVVCSDAASLPEVAGEAAVLFPAGDAEALAKAVRSVLDDPERREDLSRRGQEQAAQFSWTSAAAATVAVYGEAIGCA
jgi:glycosyltransferase involved in cell wall biosynthesis